MTAQKEEWVQVGLWRHYRSHTSSLQSLEEDLTFFTTVVYNTKSQETQNKIFLQQLKTQSMNSGFTSHYPTWTHSSFCAVILNPEVKFRLFER